LILNCFSIVEQVSTLKNMGYYDNVNQDLLGALPSDLGRVVELGCGAGVMARAYRQKSPNVNWTGIELMPDQANLAKEFVNQVYSCDVEANWPLGQDETFDCLVIGDVLEHLRDPWAILSKFVSHLKPGATTAICIPNVGHWTVIANLLLGHFPYQNQGILDKTHLRFFTLSSMLDLHRQAGIEPLKVIPRNIPVDAAKYKNFSDAMAQFSQVFNQKHESLASRVLAMQYIIVGKKNS